MIIDTTSDYMKVYFKTYGCTFNQADTDIMKTMVATNHTIVSDIQEADVVILNTCYVKLPTEQKMITKIKQIQEDYPDKTLIITGCMVEVDPDRLYKFAPDNSWIGPHKIDKINQVIDASVKGEVVHEYGKTSMVKAGRDIKSTNKLIHTLQICEGCNGGCTFCCTRQARGSLISYPIKLIVQEAKQAIENGAKELQVTAQDTACFGLDSDESFSDLLRELSDLDGEYRIRVGMMHPKSILPQLDQVIEVFKNSDKLFRFVHIPVQTGSDKVLKQMNRMHTVSDYEHIIDSFRREIPDITIATDIIVGYPTETDEDFEDTLNLVSKIKPDIIHISKYMHRPTAKSSTLDEIDHRLMKERSLKLNKLKSQVMLQNNKKYVGKTQKALITTKGSRGGFAGYTDTYKSIIVDEAEIGSFVNIKILDARRTYLYSEVI